MNETLEKKTTQTTSGCGEGCACKYNYTRVVLPEKNLIELPEQILINGKGPKKKCCKKYRKGKQCKRCPRRYGIFK